MFIKRKRI